MGIETTTKESGSAGKPGEQTAAGQQPPETGAIDPQILTPAGVRSLLEREKDIAAVSQPLLKLPGCWRRRKRRGLKARSKAAGKAAKRQANGAWGFPKIFFEGLTRLTSRTCRAGS
jgi:hypothetical protein